MFHAKSRWLMMVVVLAIGWAGLIGCEATDDRSSHDWGYRQAYNPPLLAFYYPPIAVESGSYFGGTLAADDQNDRYLGRYSSNQFAPDSTSNPYGEYGSEFGSLSINNPYGSYGNPYSPNSGTNPYAVDTPRLYGSDGTYLGKLSSNPYDPDSISNPYGTYGSPYSPNSVNNPYGQFGSPYSPTSARNQYATDPPVIIAPD